MWKVKVSGMYITGFGNELRGVDYEVEGEMPECSEIYLRSFCFSRYLKKWIESAVDKKGEKKYPIVNKIRSREIESVEKTKSKVKLLGKDILKMTWDELDDFATKYDLMEIQKKGVSGIGGVREKAALCYLTKIAKIDITVFDEYKKTPGGFDLDFKALKETGVIISKEREVDKIIKKPSLSDALKKNADAMSDETGKIVDTKDTGENKSEDSKNKTGTTTQTMK